MKKGKLFLIGLLLILATSCAENKVIDGVEYRPYGLLNENTQRNPNIEYEVSGWAVFSGVVFFELIAPPIYVFGYNLFEPVGKKTTEPELRGIVK